MAYSTSYTLRSFNPVTSILFVRVDILNNSLSIVDTIDSFPIRLPVDANGNAPVDAALTAFVEKVIGRVFNPAILAQRENLIENGGSVANAGTIYALTQDLEPGEEIPALYVLLTPDPEYTTGNVTTRSILQCIDSRESLNFTGDFGLDNGNVVSSSGLSLVQTFAEAEQAGPFLITAANDNSASLALSTFASSSPYDGIVWNGAEGFNGVYYYIEHEPIIINGTATAVFSY